MTDVFRPRIFIRDYGEPTERLLAINGAFLVEGEDGAGFMRALLLRIDETGTAADQILLSGDAQSGSDVLSLSGMDNALVLTNEGAFRVNEPDVRFTLHHGLSASGGHVATAGNAAGLAAHLVLDGPTDGVTVSGKDAGLERGLTISAGSAAFALTGSAVDLQIADAVALSGDEQSGKDRLRLAGDEQSGTDLLMISEA